ncbi:MAG: AmmeMemoRadiSam system protein B [Candidatus Goldbacteria bacterium]|nr:AmmeMemoRadiSam system protein B [Candidatus Goldiibacteriota bacterium]
MLRDPVVAGMFYDKDVPALKKHLSQYVVQKQEKYKAKAIVVPHAGYIYSGSVAGEVYSSVYIPDIIIIMGPNHTGAGKPISVMTEGVWRTPLGDVKINEPLANEIVKKCPAASKDVYAHLKEHSVEVQLPFLQYVKKGFSFIPVVLGEYNVNNLQAFSDTIAEVFKEKELLMIASTDLTHYEDSESAKEKDTMVLKAIEKLDEEEMLKKVEDNDISMCGWMPTFVAIRTAKLFGATKGIIIKYMNSGDASGDYSQVVGYGGAVII